jgi:hypothetical protein
MLQPVFAAYRDTVQVSARRRTCRTPCPRRPRRRDSIVRLAQCWNWKAAILSAVCRSLIFLFVNLPAGRTAGLRSMAIEFVFRTVASGVLGSLTEPCARASLPRTSSAAAVVLISATGHVAELLVHWHAGTPRLGASVATSIAFTLITTTFNLFVMRRGTLITGATGRPLIEDLRRLPGLLLDFIHTLWALRRCI